MSLTITDINEEEIHSLLMNYLWKLYLETAKFLGIKIYEEVKE